MTVDFALSNLTGLIYKIAMAAATMLSLELAMSLTQSLPKIDIVLKNTSEKF